MEKLAAARGKDRLDTVNSMILALNALSRSIHGWRSWIQSLRLMTKFTEKELRELESGLLKRTQDFLKYDIDMTNKYKEKIPRLTIPFRRPNQRQDDRGMYV